MDSLVLTAVLEAVSVLAGVLIAFSIDAAWDNRRGRSVPFSREFLLP